MPPSESWFVNRQSPSISDTTIEAFEKPDSIILVASREAFSLSFLVAEQEIILKDKINTMLLNKVI